jgi:hypothetical protein
MRPLSAVALVLFSSLFMVGTDARAENKCAGAKIKAAGKNLPSRKQ